MAILITAPNSVLSEIAKPVEKIDGSIKALIAGMREALLAAKDPIGVGLAAPQIGKSLRIFLAKPTNKSPIFVFINPQIITKSEEEEVPLLSNSKKIERKKPKKSSSSKY